jgi:hypothetical protein
VSEYRCVVDTCICIDIYHGNLLSVLHGFKMVLPDVLAAELHEPPGTVFVNAGWQLRTFSGDEVAAVYTLTSRYKAPSVPDLFTLLAAKRDGIILLTGDRALRTAAEQEGVEAHGFLWLLDNLVGTQPLPPHQAAQSLRSVLAQGCRLPKAECERRLRRWENV